MDRFDFFGINVEDIKREARDFAEYMKGMAAETAENAKPGYDGAFARQCCDNDARFSDLYYPRTNTYVTQDRSLVFEFMLPGFDEKGLSLSFKGDKMVLKARAPEDMTPPKDCRFQKRRFEVRDIDYREYPVPADRYDQSKVKALFRNGILTVTIPAVEDVADIGGVKIEIVKEGN
jgi:HSP20 family molecular chaperone IbpA